MKEGLAYFTDTSITTVGLLIFFGFFIAVVFWVTRSRQRTLYGYMQTLPFEKGEHHE